MMGLSFFLAQAFLVQMMTAKLSNYVVAVASGVWGVIVASLYTLVTDCLVRDLVQVIQDEGRGIICVCADDIGAILADVLDLKHMEPVFHRFLVFAGLGLKARKCLIFPLRTLATLHVKSRIKEKLEVHVPQWHGFSMSSFAM